MSRFSAPENPCGHKVARTSELCTLGCITYEIRIRAGRHLSPNVSPSGAPREFRDLLGSLSGKGEVTCKPTKE